MTASPAPPPIPSGRDRRALLYAKLAAIALAVATVVVAQRTGLLHLFGEPARVREAVLARGPWGYVAFVVAYAALQPFGLPGTVFVLAAPLIWPWPVAFGLSMAGTMAASVVGFSFARFVARDWVSKRIPVRFRAFDDALARRGFVTVVTLRFVFWMPPILHAFFGVSKVPFWVHFWGSAVGYIVPLLAIAYFGERVLDALRTAPSGAWIALGLAGLVGVFGAWYVRLRCGRPARPTRGVSQ